MIAHLLTGTRLVLVAPFALLMLRDDAAARWLAAGSLVLAIATDLLDGPAARRAALRNGRGESAWGRAFDHGTDFLFVTAGLFAMAARGAAPWLLPVLICLAFAQYVVDSYWLGRQRQLRMSTLGRWNGIFYFVPLCADVGSRALLGGALAQPVLWLGWALAASTLLSIADRLLALRRSPAVPASRA
ncbi:MAG: CDP-alcohol phosphatidyltransferase family protein [Deltaproteobacteria bacterium]|nr:CDP-alcohol phosphatidyltransferase family protein [Deltaproteobacteria bacterium]MBW2413193.1 CDP-alcohol phosphatidyltransferase family protein [Deltaproteobacteria bacterium]